MRMAGLAAVAAMCLAGAAGAQTGASSGVAMQPGRWDARGWQPGAGATPSAPADAPAVSAPDSYPPSDAGARYAPPAVGGYAPPAPGFGEAAYEAPPGLPHRPVHVGGRLPRGYLDPIYTVRDWQGYGLEQPYAGTRWVRYFDEAVLLDARGRAIAVRPVAWNAPRDRRPATPPAMRGGWTPPVASTHTERHGDTVVTTQVIPPPRGYYGGGYGPDYGWGPGVTVTPSIVTTTTTTITDPAPAATRHRRARRR